MTRRLAAILAADVVGYSRLMGEDQEGTLSALRRLRSEVFAPAVASRHGKIIKSMGDGWLVAFDSAADAVTCAMQVQDRLTGEDAIKLRIGVHTGDIVQEDEDVFGDGVNIAARLEAISAPGGVAISDAVWGALDGTLKPSFDDQGEKTLKNIAHPVKVWARGGDIAGGAAKTFAGAAKLALIPIEATRDNAEVRELAAAITGDVAAFVGVSAWVQAGITETPSDGAYVARGSLRSRGDRIRLEASLTSPSGTLLWSEKFDGALSESFDWQDVTSEAIATFVFGQVLAREELIIEQTPEDQRSAEQWFIYGILRSSQDTEGLRHGLFCMVRAIQLKPDWGRPYVQALAILFAATSIGLGELFTDYIAKQSEWLAKANELEPKASPAQAILAFAEYGRTGDRDVARKAMSALLRSQPFDPDVLMFGGYLFLYAGEPQPGLDCLQKLARYAMHTPYAAATHNGIAFAQVQLGDFDAAITSAKAALAINPKYSATRWNIVASLASLGRYEEATKQLAILELSVPGETISKERDRLRLGDTEYARRYLEGLRLAGMPE